MKNKTSRSKKLSTIAILSAITICSSIGTTTIKTEAGPAFSRPTASASTSSNSRSCWSGLRARLGRWWQSFRGIFTRSSSSSTLKRATSGVQNVAFDPTGDPTVDRNLSKLKGLVQGDAYMDGRKGTMLN